MAANQKFIEDLITSLASAGLGVNVIVVCPEEYEEEEEIKDLDLMQEFYEGAGGGGGIGGTPMEDAILMDNPFQTP